MNTFDRRNYIMDLVNTKGSVLVSEISSEMGVSEVTIRADLRLLEERGLLTRFHGGAAKRKDTGFETAGNKELNLSDRYNVAADPKRRIVAAAANLVREGDTIILDSGSTTKLLAEELLGRTNITVITNNLAAAYVLSENKDITLVVCGGRCVTKLFHCMAHWLNMRCGMLRQISCLLAQMVLTGRTVSPRSMKVMRSALLWHLQLIRLWWLLIPPSLVGKDLIPFSPLIKSI